jgi:hypothetical protein
MPLRDHFHPPVSRKASWEGFHGMWPAAIVQRLQAHLPEGYVAEPRVHSGARIEIDVATFENDEVLFDGSSDRNGGLSTAVWAPAAPTLAIETDPPDYDEYEVRIYDVGLGRQLVAAVEIVSPANKDRAEHRLAFATKCRALLQKGISVSIVDLVTERQFNLYTELLSLLGRSDPTFPDPPAHIYAASCRWVQPGGKTARLEAWARPLVVGQPLPTLPLWLTGRLAVPLDLEASYEQACRDLRIP